MEEIKASFKLEQNEPITANFSLKEVEPMQVKFVINPTPDKLSQLENDMGYITIDEVPDGMTEEQKIRLSALNMQYKEVIIPTQDLDLSTIEVDKNGAEYGFYYNSETGSLCPQNSGVDESYSYGKITFEVEADTTVTISFIQSSEENYDFGIISELDTYLQHNINNDTNVKWSGNPHGQISDSVTYDVPVGEHFITFKYVKDSSNDEGNDRFEITGVTIEGFQNKKIFDYDTGEEIDLKPDMSDYYTKSETENKYVTIDTEQTVKNKKIFLHKEEVKFNGQESVVKILSTHADDDLTTGMWAGRLTVGNKNQTFLMGVYHQVGSDTPMCGLGAHRWSDSLNDTGAAWNDIYIQPDGNTSVYIGGYNWTHSTGWLKVKNSGSNTGGKVQINKGSISNPNWQDVATKEELTTGLSYSLVNKNLTVTGGNAQVSLQDRTITTVTVDDTVNLLTFTFPAKTDGKARDFFIRLVITGDTIPTLSFIETNGEPVSFDIDDDSWAEIEQGVNILMFTDTKE